MSVKTSITSEKSITEEDLIKKANSIYKVVCAYVKQSKNVVEIIENIGKKYSDFFKTYPLIVQCMLLGAYDEFAFRLLVRKTNKKYFTEQEYFDVHGEYYAMIRKKQKRNMTIQEKNNIKNQFVKTLTEESENFKKQCKEAEVVFEEQEKKFKQLNLQELKNYYEKFDTDGTVTCKSATEDTLRANRENIDCGIECNDTRSCLDFLLNHIQD